MRSFQPQGSDSYDAYFRAAVPFTDRIHYNIFNLVGEKSIGLELSPGAIQQAGGNRFSAWWFRADALVCHPIFPDWRFTCTDEPTAEAHNHRTLCTQPQPDARGGVFTLMFGFGLYYNSAIPFFIATPLFILLNYLELKTVEEPELIIRFGQEYIDYRKCTPMFFPRFLPRGKKNPT